MDTSSFPAGGPLPSCWQACCDVQFSKQYFVQLQEFLDRERAAYEVYPAEEQVFAAFRLTPLTHARVVILGQDPYHGEGQAHGLCFSVPPGVKPPPSLMNIFKELQADLGVPIPASGCLTRWARQGVFLLNTVLTVRAGHAHSHRGKGWEQFTDSMIQCLSNRQEPLVFALWGNPAQKKRALIDESRHAVLTAAHPSPLSATRGFFGSRPFSRINACLQSFDQPTIEW